MILVSPLVQRGTVFRSTTKVPFDHTSLIATILKWRRLESRIADFG
jgi:phospholipase C